MPRRDELTYDIGQPQSRGPVPWVPLLVLVAVLGIVTLLVAGVVRSGEASQAAPAPPASGSSPPLAPASATTPLPSGSDADEGLAAPEGSQEAATAFVDAWLDRNPKTRQPALEHVAAPALVEELMLTDPANIPRARPRGTPALSDASTYSVQFTQALTGGMAIQVYLVADPEARYRWLATSVEQA